MNAQNEEFYIVCADRKNDSRYYLRADGGHNSEWCWFDQDGVHVDRKYREEAIANCRHFAPCDRLAAVKAAEESSRSFASFGYKFRALLIIPRKVWREWPNDYKGKWTKSVADFRGDIQADMIGKRTVMVGADHNHNGCVLLTEGENFEIV